MVLSACASTGGMAVHPVSDIPVPPQWVPYSRDWVMIQTPKVTAAKFVYFAGMPMDGTLEQARQLLIQSGWKETKSERFVNSEKFNGVRADFAKGEDVCRVTVIEGVNATHVDYTVARVVRPQ